MAKTKKSGKEALANGAKAIREAEAEASKAKEEPLVIPKATRPMMDVVKQRVTQVHDHLGLKIDEDTPIEESLQILDWTMQLNNHVGFMIGDVLNFGNKKWGTKYSEALNRTGRALSTLKGYAEASAKIPVENRIASLTFSVHREVLRLPDTDKMLTVLKEIGTQADKGKAPTKMEVRFKVQKLVPRKRPKRVTSGKGKRKPKAVEVPYEPTAEEQGKLDEAEESLDAAAELVKSVKLYQLVAKLTNKEKKRWLAMVEPIAAFYNSIDRVTSDY